MVYKLSFRIRKIYFDQIVAGTKTQEVRRSNHFWDIRATRAHAELEYGRQVIAVFVCGTEVHRREVLHVEQLVSAEVALGRPPSEQGREDLGDGSVYVFHLGREMDIGCERPSDRFCPHAADRASVKLCWAPDVDCKFHEHRAGVR
jgi:hypothetical protein